MSHHRQRRSIPGPRRLGRSARRHLGWALPLALLSVAGSASLLGDTPDGRAEETVLPDGAPLPTEAVEDPASYSLPGRHGLTATPDNGADIVASASTHGIPSAALSAYQRAETVIDAADEDCRLPWQLIAAIGRVESDHGRYGGSTLGTDGISRPGIIGIPLDGTRGTAEISDTDAGQLDTDTVWDRAVGPLQFIPSTWSDVGVDADGDGRRNPQDIDDAALAGAVYLCSGDDDLAVASGRRKAVYRYNHSEEYVDLVLSILDAYTAGDYASVPTYVASAVTFTLDDSHAGSGNRGQDVTRPQKGSLGAAGPTGDAPGGPAPTGDEPAGQPGEGAEPGGDDGPASAVHDTIAGTTRKVTETITKPADTVATLLTLPQAILRCTALGYSALFTPTAWRGCISRYTTGS